MMGCLLLRRDVPLARANDSKGARSYVRSANEQQTYDVDDGIFHGFTCQCRKEMALPTCGERNQPCRRRVEVDNAQLGWLQLGDKPPPLNPNRLGKRKTDGRPSAIARE
uniref:Uncharacterized protein n=1 Tax=Mesocestoides corti TaxID=53468 RepID=A0A5K3G2Q2_MESCO